MLCEQATPKYPNGKRGTHAGAAAHRKAGEQPCDDCKAGAAAYQRRYQRGRNTRAAQKQRAEGRRFNERLTAETLAAAADYEPRPHWQDDAACKGMPTEWWFPELGDVVDQATKICASCAVRVDCAATHQDEMWGVWGGIHRETTLTCATPSESHPQGATGTKEGMRRHHRVGETPCQACREGKDERLRYQPNNRWGNVESPYTLNRSIEEGWCLPPINTRD